MNIDAQILTGDRVPAQNAPQAIDRNCRHKPEGRKSDRPGARCDDSPLSEVDDGAVVIVGAIVPQGFAKTVGRRRKTSKGRLSGAPELCRQIVRIAWQFG